MRLIALLALALALAFSTGIGSAYLLLERGSVFGAVKTGDWTAWPDAAGPQADPYSRAHFSRTGRLPLAPGEGMELHADTGRDGQPFLGTCTYRIRGEVPSARLWTLSVYDADGRLLNSKANRHGFHARNILRSAGGKIDVVVSPTAKPGNWLPSGGERIRLVLRLYDTPITGLTLSTTVAPQIIREGCL
ncbi:DUF1214 domain-containing protein [Coralliovum pocilloporae]|uniref:DUF1214 domain-containing protein n=1 Tax=Coralliovum pocilloporae TaxID=3066369 RepID=UPI00330754F0